MLKCVHAKLMACTGPDGFFRTGLRQPVRPHTRQLTNTFSMELCYRGRTVVYNSPYAFWAYILLSLGNVADNETPLQTSRGQWSKSQGILKLISQTTRPACPWILGFPFLAHFCLIAYSFGVCGLMQCHQSSSKRKIQWLSVFIRDLGHRRSRC